MDRFAQKFAELSDQYGPHVIDAALAAARTEAYSTLASALIWLLLSAALAVTGRYLWRLKCEEDHNELLTRPSGAIACCLALICFLAALWCVIDPWTWVAISHPEQWIARRVLKL